MAPTPRRTGRSRSWAPTTVREVLNQPLYRGKVVWGRQRKRDQWGIKKYIEQDPSNWIEVEVPALRIVSEDL